MTVVHELPASLFESLAGGGGGPEVVHALRSAQLSKHLLLIGDLLGHWSGDPRERDAIADVLGRARDRAPDRFAEVLSAPLVGAWLAIAVRARQRDRVQPADFNHLGALAVVAAATSGVDAEAEVAVREGSVAVPSLGAAIVESTVEVGSASTARLEARDGRLSVNADGHVIEIPADPTEEAPGWRPVRWLAATEGARRIRVCLDDLDPYRHGHHAPPAPRLSAADVEKWREVFAQAWSLLGEHVPERADELRVGLRALVPLVQTDPHSARSATMRHAFGVFGLTLPPSPADFAVTMVHEFQHSKLSALLDLTPLTVPAHQGRYFAPWREDPRPLPGLLQGVYAFVGVAETWACLRGAEGLGATAELQFAEARLQVDWGLHSVEESGGLTAQGTELVERLRATTDRLLAEEVPVAVTQVAERALADARSRWQERNRDLTIAA